MNAWQYEGVAIQGRSDDVKFFEAVTLKAADGTGGMKGRGASCRAGSHTARRAAVAAAGAGPCMPRGAGAPAQPPSVLRLALLFLCVLEEPCVQAA